MRILHLEDDPQKAAIIARHLARQVGPEGPVDAVTWVTNANSFDDAIGCSQEFDLVILDNCVPWSKDDPGTHPYGAAALIGARIAGYDGPVIFISANPRGLDLGGDEKAEAYFYSDTAGWLDAIAVVRAEVSS